jgi:GDPmannose 4,6-dehydratase
MWLMLQQKQPGDYVIGTGETHSVGEFVEYAFEVAGLEFAKHVSVDKRLFRPSETNALQADPRKAKQVLGWEPAVNFRGLVNIMVDADLRAVQQPDRQAVAA